MRKGIVILLVLFGLTSCGDGDPEPFNLEQELEFFPLQTGFFRTYNVENVLFRNTGEVDTVRFFMKESVVDSFPNAESGFTYIINISNKENLEDPWEVDSVWTARRNTTNAVQTEENISFIKLVFPFEEGAIWNGNAFNNMGVDEYRMENVEQPMTLDSLSFEQTVTVIENDFEDGITIDDVRSETYSSNIGLIQRKQLFIQYNTSDEFLGLGVIEFGNDYEQNLIEYGFE
ncbi:MAG: hypothetical protein AAF363_09200 [Bacteroidota bacterium]